MNKCYVQNYNNNYSTLQKKKIKGQGVVSYESGDNFYKAVHLKIEFFQIKIFRYFYCVLKQI